MKHKLHIDTSSPCTTLITYKIIMQVHKIGPCSHERCSSDEEAHMTNNKYHDARYEMHPTT